MTCHLPNCEMCWQREQESAMSGNMCGATKAVNIRYGANKRYPTKIGECSVCGYTGPVNDSGNMWRHMSRPEWARDDRPLPELTGWVKCDLSIEYHRGSHGPLHDCLNPVEDSTPAPEPAVAGTGGALIRELRGACFNGSGIPASVCKCLTHRAAAALTTAYAAGRAAGLAEAGASVSKLWEALADAQVALVGIQTRANGGGRSYEEMLGDIAEQATAALNEIERHAASAAGEAK